jgi:hypothetical protein
VIEDPHDVRGQSCGLWWESADTARARCALAIYEGATFCGVALIAFSGLTTCEEDRELRVAELAPVMPVLAKAIFQSGDCPHEIVMPSELARTGSSDTTIIAALKIETHGPDDSLIQDLEALAREEQLLGLIDSALKEDEFALHLQPIVSLRADASAHGAPLIVEVLIRLPTEEFGVLSSHEFLDTAERNGRMPAIDRWVIRALLVWMQRNRDRWADARAVFSVNLSGKSVVRPDFRNSSNTASTSRGCRSSRSASKWLSSTPVSRRRSSPRSPVRSSNAGAKCRWTMRAPGPVASISFEK